MNATDRQVDKLSEDLAGTFGESEQEDAAARIITLLKSGKQRTVVYEDMKKGPEQIGFLQMVANGTLVSSGAWGGKRNFCITWEFRGRTGMLDLGYTFIELLQEMGFWNRG